MRSTLSPRKGCKSTLRRAFVLALLIGSGLSIADSAFSEDFSIVINKVKGLGVAAEDSRILTDVLRDRLTALFGVRVVDLTQYKIELASCLQEAPCRRSLNRDQKITHALLSHISGIGSTFTVTLTLNDLRKPARRPLVVRQTGKRGSQTFSEVLGKTASILTESAGFEDKGIVNLRELPADTLVAVDGMLPVKSGGTLETLQLSPGSHSLELRKEGFRTLTKTVRVSPGSRQALTLQLEPLPTPEASTLLPDGDTQTPRRRPIYKKAWFWTVVGAVVAGSATAVIIAASGGSDTQDPVGKKGDQPTEIGATITVGRR